MIDLKLMVFHKCPTCGAEQGYPCRTPKGRKKENAHDTRPFSIELRRPKPDQQAASDLLKAILGVKNVL